MKISCIYSIFIPKAKEFYDILSKQYSFVKEEDADVIICLGGDGFMLHCLHRYIDFNKPLYGINCGSEGFLLNKKRKNIDLLESIESAITFHLHPLVATFIDVNNKPNTAFAFNEVSFLRGKPRSAHLSITVNNEKRIDKLIGDGLLIATPVGSTAYNRSCGGNILSISSHQLAITPINPLRPLHWKGTTVHCSSIIDIENVSSDRPVHLYADFNEFNNLSNVKVRLCKEKFVPLLFDKEEDLETKIIKHQFNQ